MKRIVLLLGIMIFLTTGYLYAQSTETLSLEKDSWEGRMIVPSGKIDTLYLHINPLDNEIKLEIEIVGARSFEGSDVRTDEHSLYFKWNYDVAIDCVLRSQENGSYQGTCKDEMGNKGLFAFVPSSMADSPKAVQIFDDWVYYWKAKI